MLWTLRWATYLPKGYSMKFLSTIFVLVTLSMGHTNAEAQSKFHVVDKVAFYQVTEVQKTPFWCWAATIAMSLNAQGVDWRQEDVVLATKGRLTNETATAQEMTAFLNSWNLIKYDGQPWAVHSSHYDGIPPLNVIINSLDSGRPLIVTYRIGPTAEHAVLLYGANVLDDDTRLHSVYFFDPYTGRKGAASASDFRKSTTNSWDVQTFK
jgi:hypothetical protein